jgi:Zn-finger nucleic acid-binding protein
MHCPKCQTQILVARQATEHDVTVDQCSRCSGLWFDRAELNKVMPVAAKELHPPDDAQTCERLCPRCDQMMRRFNYPQTLVMVEVCPKCQGLWLDAGEFKEIRIVREQLRQAGKMEPYAPVTGVKGKLLAWIDSTIGSLKSE